MRSRLQYCVMLYYSVILYYVDYCNEGYHSLPLVCSNNPENLKLYYTLEELRISPLPASSTMTLVINPVQHDTTRSYLGYQPHLVQQSGSGSGGSGGSGSS